MRCIRVGMPVAFRRSVHRLGLSRGPLAHGARPLLGSPLAQNIISSSRNTDNVGLSRRFSSQNAPETDRTAEFILQIPRAARFALAVSGGFIAYGLVQPYLWFPFAGLVGWYAYRLARHALILNPPSLSTIARNPGRYRAQMQALEREYGEREARRFESLLRTTGHMPLPPLFARPVLDADRLAVDLARMAADELASRVRTDTSLSRRLAILGKPESWAISPPRDVSVLSSSSFVFLGAMGRSSSNSQVSAVFDLASSKTRARVTVEVRGQIQDGRITLEEVTIDDGKGQTPRSSSTADNEQGEHRPRRAAPPGVIDVSWKEIKK